MDLHVSEELALAGPVLHLVLAQMRHPIQMVFSRPGFFVQVYSHRLHLTQQEVLVGEFNLRLELLLVHASALHLCVVSAFEHVVVQLVVELR